VNSDIQIRGIGPPQRDLLIERMYHKKNPSQTLSPRPWLPISSRPSFQSPVPMSGSP